jgi:hypothetical protein
MVLFDVHNVLLARIGSAGCMAFLVNTMVGLFTLPLLLVLSVSTHQAGMQDKLAVHSRKTTQREFPCKWHEVTGLDHTNTKETAAAQRLASYLVECCQHLFHVSQLQQQTSHQNISKVTNIS